MSYKKNTFQLRFLFLLLSRLSRMQFVRSTFAIYTRGLLIVHAKIIGKSYKYFCVHIYAPFGSPRIDNLCNIINRLNIKLGGGGCNFYMYFFRMWKVVSSLSYMHMFTFHCARVKWNELTLSFHYFLRRKYVTSLIKLHKIHPLYLHAQLFARIYAYTFLKLRNAPKFMLRLS